MMQKIVIIRVGQQQFAIELPHIQQITHVDKMASAAAPATSQSNQAPLIDLNRFLQQQRKQPQLKVDRKALVLNAGHRLLTVIADRVETVLSVDPDQLSALPRLYPAPVRRLLPRTLRHQGRLILLLDPEALGDCLYGASVIEQDAASKSRNTDRTHAASGEDACTAETERHIKAQLRHALIKAAT